MTGAAAACRAWDPRSRSAGARARASIGRGRQPEPQRDIVKKKGEEPETLEELLDAIHEAEAEGGTVSLAAILDSIGHRSFGPLLLLAGLITVAPLVGDVPGVPTLMAILVLLTAGQLILRRDHIWLPGWLLDRKVRKDRIEKAVDRLRRPARFIDRGTRPRLTRLVRGPGAYAVAVACVLIALAMPPMELVPFSANLAGAALTAFGLALVSRDGVLALIGFALTSGGLGVVLYHVI